MEEKLNKIKDIFKRDKKLFLIFILAVIGIVLLLLSEFFDNNSIGKEKESVPSGNDYVTMIENKLSEIVSSVDGAGKVDVMVTIETGEENVYARQVKTDEEKNDNKSSSDYEYEYIVIKTGSSTESGMLLKVIEPNIRGVAIVCDGGDNAAVRENIINIVSAVLDIKTNKISVCKRKS